MNRYRALTSAALLFVPCVACSSKFDDVTLGNGEINGKGGASSRADAGPSASGGVATSPRLDGGVSTASGDGGSSGSTASGGSLGTGVTTRATPDAGECAAVSQKAELLEKGLYVMVDQSSSMGDAIPGGNVTWWHALQQGFSLFLNDPRTSGISVGIQYFPLEGVAPASCMADYATPEVEVAPLPGNTKALGASIANHMPTAFTPTGPALTGALAHMKTWATTHPGTTPAVVLITDGFPTECDPQDIADLAALAAQAFNTQPSVSTYVVALNLGAGGRNLDKIAMAGGTGQAVSINDGDVGQQLASALASTFSTSVACTYVLPSPTSASAKRIDPSRLSVRLTTQSGSTMVDAVVDAGDCANHDNRGFYVDDPMDPRELLLCMGTCGDAQNATVDVLLGCASSAGTK